jgi:hypothetical protein
MGKVSDLKKQRRINAAHARKGKNHVGGIKISQRTFKTSTQRDIPLKELRKNWRGRYSQIRTIVTSMLPNSAAVSHFIFTWLKSNPGAMMLLKQSKLKKKKKKKTEENIINSIAQRFIGKVSNFNWDFSIRVQIGPTELISTRSQDNYIKKNIAFPIYEQINNVGYYRSIQCIIQTFLNSLTPQIFSDDSFKLFGIHRNIIVWIISMDGSPQNENTGTVLGTTAPWNLKEKIRSPTAWRTIFIIDGKEDYETLVEPCSRIEKEISDIEKSEFVCHGRSLRMAFVSSSDMKMSALHKGQTNQSSRNFSPHARIHKKDINTYTTDIQISSGTERESNWSDFQKIIDKTPKTKISDVLQDKYFGQYRKPLLPTLADKDAPDPLHLDINGAMKWIKLIYIEACNTNHTEDLVKELKQCSLEFLANKFEKKSITKSKKEKNEQKNTATYEVKERLIGRQAIIVMHNFGPLGSLFSNLEGTEEDKMRRKALYLVGLLLGLISEIYSQLEPSKDEITYLRLYCKAYFSLHVKFFREKVNPTVYTIGVLVPYYMHKIYEKYGVGLGYFSLQAPESKNRFVKDILSKHSNRHELKKQRKVLKDEYLLFDWLPSKGIPVQTSNGETWTPRVNRDDGKCICGKSLEINNDEQSQKKFWLHTPKCNLCSEVVELFIDMIKV